MFVSNVKGVDEYNIECDSATVDVPFTCNITTNQTVYVNTDLQVYKGSTKISKDSSIEFKANKADKYDIALSFTSIMEMVKQRQVRAEQKALFGDIKVAKGERFDQEEENNDK